LLESISYIYQHVVYRDSTRLTCAALQVLTYRVFASPLSSFLSFVNILKFSDATAQLPSCFHEKSD